jgi:methionyl-tRNA formyltransferase
MRIVLITGNDLSHRYVANRLSSSIELCGIVVDQGKPLGTTGRLRQLYRRYTLPQLASRACLAGLRRVWRDKAARRSAMISTFGPESCLEFARPDLVRHVNGINTPEAHKLVSSLQPDAILVFGTGIVGPKILSLPRKIALNMHTGVSPFYRGADCTFWPVHNEELHMLGATVHECTMVVDGGKIFGTTRVELQPDDGLFTVYSRCVAAGATLYAQKVRELVEGHLEGNPQDFSIGKEYKAYMRGVQAEWKARRSIRAGLIRNFVAPAAARASDLGSNRG